jgi:5-oxoprolinase (ATP-hydrolysing) subunit A
LKKIDLNVDIGEGFPYDGPLVSYATSANICCGEHAGSWELTKETIHRCLEAGVRIGLHPGYPEPANMGRMPLRPELARAYHESVQRQVERFFFFVPAAYLKPHGALYNDAAGPGGHDARAMVEAACRRFQLPLMALPGTPLAQVASSAGVELLKEGFADRAYRHDGTLVSRTEAGAVLRDASEIKRQVLFLAPKVDSICLHGDTEGCVEFAELIFATLVDAGYEVGA